MLTSQPADYETHTIAATVHGRYLVRRAAAARGHLIGFHGYAENAERHLAELLGIPGAGDWTVAAVQALHPFYVNRTGEVVASWMTSQDRELAIADNRAYIRSIVAALAPSGPLVLAGFSQGVAMAYRAAHELGSAIAGVIALGGDVPPELTTLPTTLDVPRVLVGRGTREDWYSEEKFEKDLRFLRGVTEVETCVYDGGHEWTDEFRQAAGRFLKTVLGAAC